MSATLCPACSAPMTGLDTFCAACGHKVGQTVAETYAARAQAIAAEKIGRARKWLFFVAVITWVSGAVIYFTGRSEVETQIAAFERQVAGVPAAERDQLLKEKVGMTYDEILAHDRGQVNLLLAINIGLGVAYFGLGLWTKRNAATATVVALLLFITVHAVNAFVDPKTIVQGIIMKIAVIGALIAAVTAALEARRALADARESSAAAAPPAAPGAVG